MDKEVEYWVNSSTYLNIYISCPRTGIGKLELGYGSGVCAGYFSIVRR